MKSINLVWCAASIALTGAVACATVMPHKTLRAATKQSNVPTYSKDIAPIIYQNCTECHRNGEVAPFTLNNYADAKKRAKVIAGVTESRFMPPWKADSHGEFRSERKLTDAQIATIKAWADGSAPEGNKADLPPAPHFTDGWSLGKPDLEVTPTESYSLSSDGADVYRCFVVPTNYDTDRWVSAVEVRPGNSKIVHHVIAYLDTTGKARELDAADPGPGYTSYGGIGTRATGTLGGWAPGTEPHFLPAGVGIRLPKGTDIVLQVHYHKSGKPETDLTKIGIYFSKEPIDKRLRILPVIDPALYIKPGDSNYAAHASVAIPADITVTQVMPHMHLLGHDMTVSATLPDGTDKQLVSIPDWDFNWQLFYDYKDPVKLPQGSKVSLVAHYDNSEKNERNPSNPPKLVTWGEQTTDEMCIAFVFYTVDSEHLLQGIAGSDVPVVSRKNMQAMAPQLITWFDKDGDSKLDASEFGPLLDLIQQRSDRAMIKQALNSQSLRDTIITHLYDKFDTDKDGKLDATELAALTASMGGKVGNVK